MALARLSRFASCGVLSAFKLPTTVRSLSIELLTLGDALPDNIVDISLFTSLNNVTFLYMNESNSASEGDRVVGDSSPSKASSGSESLAIAEGRLEETLLDSDCLIGIGCIVADAGTLEASRGESPFSFSSFKPPSLSVNSFIPNAELTPLLTRGVMAPLAIWSKFPSDKRRISGLSLRAESEPRFPNKRLGSQNYTL